MTDKQKQQLLDDMLRQVADRENDFPAVDDLGKLPIRYRGYALEINDHGNVTVWNCFKNGKLREVVSRV